MTPEEIWEGSAGLAEWERVDRVDDYCWDCNISLEIDGYKFSGYGTESCGEREIDSLECECPDGSIITLI